MARCVEAYFNSAVLGGTSKGTRMNAARYLEDGKLTIFKRSGVYYARLRISPGKYFWRSLKTTDEATAIRAGRKLLYQTEERVEIGLPPKSIIFRSH
jgi:hypothetical protein